MPNINTKFTLTGEKEYKQAISDIGARMGVLDSEMRKVSETYAKNGDSQEALTAKNAVLTKKIAEQTEKVRLMREALKQSEASYGEADTRTLKWQQSLNNAEAELQRLNNAVDENNRKMQEAEQGMEKSADEAQTLGDKVGALAERFGIKLPDGIKKSLDGMGSLDVQTAVLAGGFAAAAAAIVKVEKALIEMTNSAAASVDNLLTLSMQTGQSTQQLQVFEYASELLDVGLDTLQTSLTRLTQSMQSAQSGSGKAADAFDELGVKTTNADGSLRSANDVFYDAVDALGKIRNETERDAKSMEIFGRSAQELNPLIIQGSAKLREYAKEAENVGYILDERALKALGETDDALQRLKKTQEGVKRQLAAEFAPYLTQFYGDMTSGVQRIGRTVKESGIVDAFGMLLKTFGEIMTPMDKLTNDKIPSLERALRPLALVIAGIADTSKFITSLLRGDFRGASAAAGFLYGYGTKNNLQTLQDSYRGKDTNRATLSSGYGSYYDAESGKYYGSVEAFANEKYLTLLEAGDSSISGTSQGVWVENYLEKLRGNASGTYNWSGGVTRVGENGPETMFLPSGTRIMSASESRYGGDGAVYIDRIVIDAANVREFSDIVEMVQGLKMQARMGVSG